MSTKTPKTKKTRRDNFSSSVIIILQRRSGGLCCKCETPTFGPSLDDPIDAVNIGKAAHITAASEVGPRYDPNMSSEERASATNGMWMCSNCHDIIDKDETTYTIEILKEMKKKAERKAGKQTGKGKRGERDDIAVGVSATTIVKIHKAKAKILALSEASIDQTQAEEMLESVSFINFEVNSYLPEVGTEMTKHFKLLMFHCTEPAIVIEVLRRLDILAYALNEQWTTETQVEQICKVVELVLKEYRSKKNDQPYQQGMALLATLARYEALKEKELDKIPTKYVTNEGFTDNGPNQKKIKLDGDMAGGPPPVGGTEAGGPPPLGGTMAGGPPPLGGTEAGGPPPLGGIENEDRYLELMRELCVCDDPLRAEEIEDLLISMGYEPNVV